MIANIESYVYLPSFFEMVFNRLARCSRRFRHFIYEDSLWYHKSIESSYISSSVPIDNENHEEFYWRNFFIAEHTTEYNWRTGIGLRQQLGYWSASGLVNFVENMVIYEGKLVCVGQAESRANKNDMIISEPRCDVWGTDGLYLAKLAHSVAGPFPNTERVFSGLDVNATEIITASGDTLRIFNNDDHYELRNSYDFPSPIRCFEKAKGTFYVALYKQSAIYIAGTSNVLEGHQEPILCLKRLGNSGHLVSMTVSSALVWNLNKNPAHCIAVIGQGLHHPQLLHFDFPSKTLFASYFDGSIAVWKTTTDSKSSNFEIKLTHTMSKHTRSVSCMDVDSTTLVSASSEERTILLWNHQTGNLIDSIDVKEATEIISIKFCRGLIVCLLQRKAIVFDRTTRKKLCNLHLPWNGKIDCTSMALEKDIFAIGSGYGTCLWNFKLTTAEAKEKEHPVLKMHKLEIHLY